METKTERTPETDVRTGGGKIAEKAAKVLPPLLGFLALSLLAFFLISSIRYRFECSHLTDTEVLLDTGRALIWKECRTKPPH